MEEPENSKTWFIMHDGERSGPYSMEDLNAKVEFHEINPRLDMAWKEGMDDWIPAGEVDGLFEINTKAEAAEKKQTPKPTAAAYTLRESEYNDNVFKNVEEKQEWEGVSRGGFFFFCYIFPIIWWVGLFYGFKMLQGILKDEMLPLVMGCFALLPFLLLIFAILKRFQNLAMSRVWFLGLFAPLINLWLGYRLFACPPGYAEHKKLGVLGWILAIIYWLPLLGVMALGGIVAIKGPEMFKDVIEKNRAQYEELKSKAEELTQTPEEAEKKKAEEKGPSIIPIRK